MSFDPNSSYTLGLTTDGTGRPVIAWVKTNNIPATPLPMSQMSSPVKATIDAITANPDSAAYHAASDFATPASVTAAINALIAAAPGALNTLKELADAMGDDPNFAVTVTNALAGKASAPHLLTATVDFGYSSGNGEGDVATLTISASWIGSSSRIICLNSPADSADHTVDEVLAEDIRFSAANIVPGVSFDLRATAPFGTWGRHDCVILAF